MKLEESDFETMQGFPLGYRWTDSRWNKLPTGNLAKIRPLTPNKASEAHNLSIQFLENNGLSESFFRDIERIGASIEASFVGSWLLNLIAGCKQDVVVSWDAEHAVTVDWETFSTYWSDFCYPASDDVTIFPLDLE